MRTNSRAAFVLVLVGALSMLAAACGDSDGDLADVDATPAPEADASDDDATPDPLEDPFASPETFAEIMDTEFGRQAFAEGMAESGEISVEQARCLIDGLDFEMLFLLGVAEGEPDAGDTAALFGALDACGITPDQLLG